MTRGLSQEKLAERCGLDRKTISRVETGSTSLLLDRLLRIARALDVPAALLLTPLGPDETWPPPH
jgi:transcriptional regulator with XRE-family HTH domain